MSEPIQIPLIETSALRYHMEVRDKADEILREVAKVVMQRLGAPDGSQIQVLADGGMVIVPPAPAPEPAE